MVTHLVANKISGRGSCLIWKLQNSPHNCEKVVVRLVAHHKSCNKQKQGSDTLTVCQFLSMLCVDADQCSFPYKGPNKAHLSVIQPPSLRLSHRVMSFYRDTLRSVCNPELRQADTPGASLRHPFHRYVIVPRQKHLNRMTNLRLTRCPG